MILTPENTQLIAHGLDHPECVCVDDEGTLYAGGEAGQLYRIDANGEHEEFANTGGFVLGIAIDGAGRVHACDIGNKAVMCIEPDGTVRKRSSGTTERPMQVPNYPVFDANGNLYVSDSGDFWERTQGTGCIYRIAPDDSTTLFHEGPFLFANGLAIDPEGDNLYVVQSTSPDVVRIPLAEANGEISVTHQLPEGTVPDGIAFTDDGRLVIACYKPDKVYLGLADGGVEDLCEDPSGELLNRPTNAAIHNGKIYLGNLGGWHITAIDTVLKPGPIHRPMMSE